MESLFTVICLGPMALYLLVLASINARSCPTVISGRRDVVFLGLGLVGFVFAGPIQALVPINAIVLWRVGAWGLMVLLYILLVLLISFWLRPRIVLYNISDDEARSLLSELALKLDFEARWAGRSLNLPGLGVHFYLENWSILKNVSLVAAGSQADPKGWIRLEQSLLAEVPQIETGRNPAWKYFAVCGTMIFLGVVATAVSRQSEIFDALKFYLFSYSGPIF